MVRSPSTFSDFFRIGARLCACDYIAFCGMAFCAGAKKVGYSVRLTDTPAVFELLDQDGKNVDHAAIDIEDFDQFESATESELFEESSKLAARAISLFCDGAIEYTSLQEYMNNEESLFHLGCRSLRLAEYIISNLNR